MKTTNFLITAAMVAVVSFANAQNYKSNFGYNSGNYKNPVLANKAKTEEASKPNHVFASANTEANPYESKANYKIARVSNDNEVLVVIAPLNYADENVSQSLNYKMPFRSSRKAKSENVEAPKKQIAIDSDSL